MKSNAAERKKTKERLRQTKNTLKDAKEAAEASKNRFEFLVTSSPAVIYTSKIYGDLGATFISPNVKKQTGHEPGDFIKDASFWANHIHPDDKQRIFKGLEQLFKKGQHTHEYRFKYKDGTYHWMRDEMSLVKDEKGKLKEIIGYWIDITERKQAEKVLKKVRNELEEKVKERTAELCESEKRYRSVVEDQTELICRWRPDGTLIFVNEVYCRYFGKTREELIGKKFMPLIPKEDQKIVKKIVGLISKKNPAATYEHRVIAPNGEIRWQQWTDRGIFDDSTGRLAEFQSVGSDITEHKKAEEALRESEERYKALFESSRDAIMTLEPPSWKFTSGNLSTVRMFATKNEKDFISRGPWQYSPEFQPDGQPSNVKAKKMIMKAMKDGVNFFEWTHKRLSGEEFSATVLLTRMTLGGKTFLQATVRDITERKKADEELLKLKLGIERAGQAIFITDIKGSIIYVNPAFEKIYGYTAAEVLGKNPRILKSNKTPVSYYKKLWKNLLQKKALGSDMFNKTKDGRLIFIKQSANPIIDKSGEIIGFLAIQSDITKQKQAEDKIRQFNEELNQANILLKNEQKKLEVILQSVGDGLFVLNKNKKIMLANKATEKLSGHSQKELIGQKYTTRLKFINEKTKKPHTEFVDNIFKTGQISIMSNHTALVRKDKKMVPVADSAAPLKDKDGKVIGCVVAFRDVTREREIDQMKSEFVSIASHQLRTPLTGIKWFVQLLMNEKTKGFSEEQIDFLQQIFISNERMIKLVEDLLNVSRIETGHKFNIVKKLTLIFPIVKEVIDNLAIPLKNKKITIKMPAHCSRKLELFVDAEKMYQVFYNLIDNAVKYSRENGVIKLGCSHNKKGEEVVFYVKDNGLGIPKYQHKRIFQKFFRADNVMVTETSGSGLGLYIVKAIVEAHGGNIWFESTENKGTTFYVALPMNHSSLSI